METKTILHYEDDAGIQQMVKLVVENASRKDNALNWHSKYQYDVFSFVDPDEAFSFFNENHVDLIIADVMHSKMSGYEFLNKLKSDKRLQVIPFITLSAIVEDEDYWQLRGLGANAVLSKPFNTRHFLRTIDNLVDKPGNRPNILFIWYGKFLRSIRFWHWKYRVRTLARSLTARLKNNSGKD